MTNNAKLLLPLLLIEEAEEENRRRLMTLLLLRRRMQIRTRNDVDSSAFSSNAGSFWSHLYANGSDEALIDVIGLNRRGFEDLLKHFKCHYQVKYNRGKGGRPTKVDAAQALGMILHYYCGAMELKTLGLLHGCRRNTTSRIVMKAEEALEKALRKHPLATIRFPSKDDQQLFARKVEEKYPLVKNRFGFIDGKNYDVQQPSDIDLQNAMYNGWLHNVFVTGCICVAVDGCIIWAKHNAVGSWNDGDTSRELQDKLLDENLVEADYGIVSDTAFPVGSALMRKIISPLKEGELERANPAVQGMMLQVSSQITSLRQACEWGVGSIEKVWRQLLHPLPYNQEVRRRRLNNIFRLWNFRVRTTGISQVRNTFFGNSM